MPLRFSSTVLTATTTAIPSPILYLDATDYDGSSATWTAAVGSDATLQNTPTYNLSSPTYFSFNGVNETATTADLSASFGTESVTLEVWVRTSSDNGVIIAKQGDGGGYHLSVMEIVSGNLKVGLWNGAGTTSATVGAVTRNAWQHYVLTYNDATNTLTGYLNAATSSSNTLEVDGPTSLRKFVLCASDVTNMGDGTALSADIGLFRVWNSALTASQVQEIYEENFPRFGPVLRLDANDLASYPGSGTTVTDLSGNNYTHTLTGATYTVLNGVKCFDCTTGTKRVVVNGTGPTLPTSGYTYITWARLEAVDPPAFRTLLYTDSPRYTPITIPDGTNTLGYWDTEFSSSGYDLASAVGDWVQYAVVGDNSSQTFYINGSQAGNSIARGAGGTTHFGWGANHTVGQPWGYVANLSLYNTKLTQKQIQQNYSASQQQFATPAYVESNLVLRLDPDLASSYSGSGSTWYDVAGTADNITLVNSPTYTSGTPSYFTFNGTNQYGNSTTTGVVNSTAYTKSAWFYLNGYQDNNIFSGDGHFIYMGPQASIDKKIYCGHADWPLFTAYPSTATIDLGTWYNVTLTFSTTNGMTLYINGTQDSTYTVRKTAVPGTRTANIAAYISGNLLNGRIGKVLCYSAELTAGEVLQNFNADKATYGL